MGRTIKFLGHLTHLRCTALEARHRLAHRVRAGDTVGTGIFLLREAAKPERRAGLEEREHG